MSGENTVWCYVAADPKQPGAAWAVCADNPEWVESTAKVVADYIDRGATVMRVDREAALAMLEKWMRPSLDSIVQAVKP